MRVETLPLFFLTRDRFAAYGQPGRISFGNARSAYHLIPEHGRGCLFKANFGALR